MKLYARPGPTAAPHHQGQVIDEETGNSVAVTRDDPDGRRARLFAAAPLLLSACRDIEIQLRRGYPNPDRSKLREAICEATAE